MIRRHKNLRVVIVTGLSGSGKSTALKALEDIGFLCVDNLPIDLLPIFLAMRDRGAAEVFKVALVMDIREPRFLTAWRDTFENLEKEGYDLEIIFLDASNEVLIRRFSQTRRRHPAGESGSVSEAIVRERQAMADLKSSSDLVYDTSELSVHELKNLIIEKFSGQMVKKRLQVNLMSFGYKYGLPYEADIAMDVRFLPNPYFVEELRKLDGRDKPIIDYVLEREVTASFLDSFAGLIKDLLPLYEAEGKAYLTIGLGCTGGRHRSVAVVNKLAELLAPSGYDLTVRHRDIELG